MSTSDGLVLMQCVAVVWTGLSALYVICLVVGGGMILISLASGGDDGGDFEADADLDLDLDAEFDADFDMEMPADGVDFDAGDVDLDGLDAAHAGAHGSGFSVAEWLSMRFFVFFAATFGFIGTVMGTLSGYGTGVVFAVAFIGGLMIGQSVHQAVRYLHSSGGNDAINATEYLRKAARVTIAIAPPERGEVATHVRGRTRYVPARSKRADDTFPAGQPVAIVGMKNGTAEVISRKEFVQVTETDPE